MKKYKLIKEYPGSLPLGTEFILKYKTLYCSDEIAFLTLDKIQDFPEYFEEIVDKEYELLTFKKNPTSKIIYKYNHDCPTIDSIIYSVKRLSDGEVFTIGDKVTYNDDADSWIIEGLSINSDGDHMMANEKGTSVLDCKWSCINHSKFRKVIIKQKLFTTEDGVDIFEGDIYSYTRSDFSVYHNRKASQNEGEGKEYYYRNFSTKEKAEEYIIMNKPCLSVNDITDLFRNQSISYELKLLAKSKLNIK